MAPDTWTATAPEPPPAAPTTAMSFTLTVTTTTPVRPAVEATVELPVRSSVLSNAEFCSLRAGTPTSSTGWTAWVAVSAATVRSTTSPVGVGLSWIVSPSMRTTT